ncbi:hypothetical protein EF888_20035 [Silicimonas algicola]|uniref:Uncharacterized protein n=1 Tax=Silicimonas algicola TaxID=1826607 RepID=A0A316GJI0_9RHOB|nr:hypothetical protein [Silicimonas algicola]AZQ69221.1 hypothetical protein EF888_20035 [Silicimonas algicola]PWK54967.1 hypothetical protein C8D95_10953 [Silicimonas algicola]
MQKKIETLVALAIAASLGGAAIAQDTDASASPETGSIGTDGELDSSTTAETIPNTNETGDTTAIADASANADMNYGSVISTLNSGALANVDLSMVDADSTINWVLLSQIEGSEQANALDQALESDAQMLDDFQAQIGSNAALTAALVEEGYTPEDVVAASVSADDSVTVVIDDRS